MKLELKEDELKYFHELTPAELIEILKAGAERMAEAWKIGAQSHRGKTGSMQANIGPGKYTVDIDSASVAVYPQGADPRGVSNAAKAYIINYGYGGRKTKKTGDKWVNKAEAAAEDSAHELMGAKYEEILRRTR